MFFLLITIIFAIALYFGFYYLGKIVQKIKGRTIVYHMHKSWLDGGRQADLEHVNTEN